MDFSNDSISVYLYWPNCRDVQGWKYAKDFSLDSMTGTFLESIRVALHTQIIDGYFQQTCQFKCKWIIPNSCIGLSGQAC